MKKIIATLILGGVLAACTSTLAAQELGLSQVGANCAQFFVPSQVTQGDVPVKITNSSSLNVLVAWINFAGNALVVSSLAPGDTFSDSSHPQHRYVIMDGNLNCTGGFRLGIVGDHFYVR